MYLPVHHGLSCSNGGLVTIRHNKVCDNILYLTRQALPSHCVHGKNFIHQGHSILEEEVCHGRGVLETIWDVLIWGLWGIQTDAIIDIRFQDSGADTYKHEPMEILMTLWENQKKDKNRKHCQEQQELFLHLFFPLMAFLERRPWSYSRV